MEKNIDEKPDSGYILYYECHKCSKKIPGTPKDMGTANMIASGKRKYEYHFECKEDCTQ